MRDRRTDSKYPIGYLLFVFLTIACTPQQKEQTAVDKINGTVIDTKCSLLNPVQLQIDGDTLWISDFGANPMVTATSVKSGAVLATILYKGRGPFEGMPPVNILIQNNKIYFHSRGNATLFSGNKSDILAGKTKLPTDKLVLDRSIDRCLPLGDSLLLASGTFKEGRFALIDPENPKRVTCWGMYPDFWEEEKNYNNIVKSRFHQSRFFRNSQSNRIAAVGTYTLTFMDLTAAPKAEPVKDILLHGYKYDYSDSGQFRYSKKRAGVVNGVKGAAANDSHIYILFDSGTDIDSRHPLIWVFDWDGNLIRKIDAGEEISPIGVDEMDAYLYAVKQTEENTCILRLPLRDTTRQRYEP